MQTAAVEAPEPPPEVTPPEPDERTDQEILEELGLPDPATLQPGDDIKGFMQAAVPMRLRRMALRQLWRSNPVLANLDELLEYGEDYTDAATVVENLQTAYQVGRGFWTEEDEEREREAEERAAEKAALAEECETEDQAPDDDSEKTASVQLDNTETPAPETDQATPTDAPVGPTSRRMTFHYEE